MVDPEHASEGSLKGTRDRDAPEKSPNRHENERFRTPRDGRILNSHSCCITIYKYFDIYTIWTSLGTGIAVVKGRKFPHDKDSLEQKKARR